MPHHDDPHGPHRPDHHPRPPHPHIRQRSKYPEHAVGVLGCLLDQADDFADIEELKAHLDRREPGELKYLAPALKELETGGNHITAKDVLRLMADIKAIEYYERDKSRVLHGLNGNGVVNADGVSLHALVVPIPREYADLLEGISLGKIYVLPDHHVPHWLENWDVAALPTRFRAVKAELGGALSISFEGYFDRGGRVLTRSVIVEMLSDLAEAGCRPLLRIVEMPHRPRHEQFIAIEDGYEIERA